MPDAAEPLVHVGDVLVGKYRVEAILGVGGMGMVVAARHLALDEKVALKFMLPAVLADKSAIERFLREARAAVKLKGEHVARVLDVGTLDQAADTTWSVLAGSPYIVMEYLDGHDLEATIQRRGSLPLKEAVELMLQACEGLAEAHALGIVHRDLKPQNLFLTRNVYGAPLVKILDFGISKVVSQAAKDHMSLTSTQTVIGSPLYMSPEQMRASKELDARTDIWSLGIVLYQLLTGRMPFEGDTMPQLCAMVMTEPPRPLRDVRADLPESIVRVVNKCLQKDPAQRYPNVSELARALAAVDPTAGKGASDRISMLLREKAPESVAVPTNSAAFEATQAVPSQQLAAQARTGVSWGAGTGTTRSIASKRPLVFAGIGAGALIVGLVVYLAVRSTGPSGSKAAAVPSEQPKATATATETASNKSADKTEPKETAKPTTTETAKAPPPPIPSATVAATVKPTATAIGTAKVGTAVSATGTSAIKPTGTSTPTTTAPTSTPKDLFDDRK